MSESWEDSEPLPMGMVSDASKKSTQSVKSAKSAKSAKSSHSEKPAKSSATQSAAGSQKSSRSASGESSKNAQSEHEESSAQSEPSSSSTAAKLARRPDLDAVVGKKGVPAGISRPNIQIALSGSKLVFTAEDAWRDLSDHMELQSAIHPVIAENINLKKRAELLVRLVSESQYENQQLESEMKECDEVIKQLRKFLGEKIEEEEEEEEHPENEPEDETGTSF